MAERKIQPAKKFTGHFRVPGDKSISHRSLILAALAEGESQVTDLLECEDIRSTRRVLEALGVRILDSGYGVTIRGRGLAGFKAPVGDLDCGNSGTTLRLMMGVLAGSNLNVKLVGDASLNARPMARVALPLNQMGATIDLTDQNTSPVVIRGAQLQGISYELPVASAQVKSAILLAGLFAEGSLELTGKISSRDHTERMLQRTGVRLDSDEKRLSMKCGQRSGAFSLSVPGDPSSAAFFLAAGAMILGSDVYLEDVCLNETRLGFVRALKRMGADITFTLRSEDPEPRGDIRVRGEQLLSGIEIDEVEVASLIDELPLLAVVAATARGVTSVKGASELRVKESDRIEMIARNLRAMGAKINTFSDGFVIDGVDKLQGATLESGGDHRIAMACAVAALRAVGETTVKDSECVSVSYPAFFGELERGICG